MTAPSATPLLAISGLRAAYGKIEALKGVGSTAENLGTAVGVETYEYTQMYPPMLSQAVADKHPAKRMFGYAVKAEAVHAKLYQMALEAAKQSKDLTETKFFLCPVCGYIELGEAPASCPVCGKLCSSSRWWALACGSACPTSSQPPGSSVP